MRFDLKKVTPFQARLGTLSDFPSNSRISFETPLLLLHTKGASIPHISREVLQHLYPDPCPLLISFPTTLHMAEALQEYKEGIAKFSGLKEHITWCSLQDPAKKVPSGYNTKSEISVWTNSGRALLTTERYMSVIEAMKCDVFESLCDADNPIDCGEKRKRKCVEVTAAMLERCISDLKPDTKIFMLGSIIGGLDLEYREKSASHASRKSKECDRIIGYSLCGLLCDEHSMLGPKELSEAVKASLKAVGSQGVRTAFGCWTPDQLLTLAGCGVDVFDSSFPYCVTQRNAALSFKYSSFNGERIPIHRESNYYEVLLSDKCHEESFIPLVEGCTCLTCRKHTRAYIHHLVNVRELLASTLLMIHNLHHYLEFFKFIRQAFAEDQCVIIL